MGTMFLRSIDTSEAGLRLDGQTLFSYIEQAIEEVGKENVVQVLTLNFQLRSKDFVFSAYSRVNTKLLSSK